MRRAILTAALLTGAGVLNAQTTADGITQRSAPAWMTAWSPFAPLVDLTQILPAPVAPPDLVGAPAPRVGLWWTAGTPGAMPFEVSDHRTTFRATGGGVSGDYRRAQDPEDVTVFQGSAFSWSPIANSGGAAGSVLVDQERAGAMPFAATLVPYATDPFVVTDTTMPEWRRVRARLEGAFAWRFGTLGIGATAGIEESDERTLDARFPHLGRSSTPALRAGLVYAPGPAVRVAAFGRWISGGETITLVPRTAGGLVFPFAGYVEPDSTAVALNSGYFRRSERSAYAGGVGAAGRALGADWVAFVERALRHNSHFSARIADPPTDRWDADGWSVAGAGQRRFADVLLATAEARYETLDGDAQRSDLDGVVFRAHEDALRLVGELRYEPHGSAWTATMTLALSRVHRWRYDYLVEVGADLVEWTPSAAAAAAWRTGRTTVALGVSGATYGAQGSIPDANLMGPVYQRVIAPGMALAAMQARPLHVILSLGHHLGTGTTLIADGAYTTLERSGPPSTLSYQPDGKRTGWAVSVRVVTAR